MSVTLFAQPHNIEACGFYFEDAEAFAEKAANLRDRFGDPVEEFEIQFIDGGDMDAELARAWELNQCNFCSFIDAAEEWDDHQKLVFALAVGECGYDFDPSSVDPDTFDIDIYSDLTMCELAEQFLDDGLFGEVPEPLANYIDLDAIARDLSVDYTETTIAGQRIIYRAG